MSDFEVSDSATSFGDEVVLAAACGILAYDETGQCVLANPAAAEIVGTTVANIRQQNFRQLESWRSSGMLAMAEAVLATGETRKGEFHSRSTYDRYVWISCKFSVFTRAGRRYLLLVAIDNTKRAEVEQAVLEGRDFLNQLINGLTNPIFVKDRQHRFVMVNDAACEFIGRSRDEHIGKTSHDLFPPEQAAAHWASDEQVFASPTPLAVDNEILDFAGKLHQIIIQKFVFKNKAGEEFLVGMIRDVTQQKCAEQSLRESEALYQSLVGELPCGIFRKDAAGRYVFVNDQFARVNGLLPADILGRLPTEFGELVTCQGRVPVSARLHGQRQQLGEKGLVNHEQIMRTGETIVLDEFLTLWDGSQKYFQVIKSPIRDAAGAVIGSQGMQFDITERKRAEIALEESETRYRSLYRNMAQGLAYCRIISQNGKPVDWEFLDVNTAYLRLTGLEDVVGRSISELIPRLRELNPELLERYGRVALTGRPDRFENYNHALGKWFSKAVYSPQRDHFVVILDEITERKVAEEQLRKLSQAVEQSPVSIMITDRQGIIEYVNPKLLEVTGYTPAEVLGRKPSILKSSDPEFTQARQYKKLWATILSGQAWHGEFHNRKKNGELFWEVASISPITDADGKITHFVAVKEDITRQKRLEVEFRQVQKMEAFGRLAAGVAHDFNNILTAILCNAELIQGEGALGGIQQEALTEIKTAGERAANLTRQLLLFSRQKPMQTKRVQMNEVVENMGKLLRRLIGEHILLTTKFCAGETPVNADASMLEQVLLNLAVNSRDAMPKGGELGIATEPLIITEATGRRQCGRFIRFSVSDTGSGISPQHLDRIFEPFFTTKEVGKGTGLGLATVFGIIEQHKGWIEVESQVGLGTTFHIYLPRHEAGTDTDFIAKPKARAQGGTETILLVEDEPALRKLARAVLMRMGYKVLEAGSAETALETWKQHAAEIALLFTDMVMPGRMSGLELSQQMLKDKPGLKVMYTSGYTDEMLKEGSELRHAPNFLEKPYGTEVLLRMVRSALDR